MMDENIDAVGGAQRPNIEESPTAGIFNDDAGTRLNEALHEIEEQLVTSNFDAKCRGVVQCMSQACVALGLLSGFVSLAAGMIYCFGYHKESYKVWAQAAVISLAIMADIGCQARAQDLKESEVVERFKARVKNIHLPANIEGCSGMYGSSSLQGVNAFRHGKWVFIPKILLLAGDVILDHITHQIRAIKDTVLTLRLRAFFTPTQLPFTQPTDNNSFHVRTDGEPNSDEEDSAADDDDDGDLGYKSRSSQQGCNIPLPSAAMQTCIHSFLTKLFGVSIVVV